MYSISVVKEKIFILFDYFTILSDRFLKQKFVSNVQNGLFGCCAKKNTHIKTTFIILIGHARKFVYCYSFNL